MSSKDICELGSFLHGEESSINGLNEEIEAVDNNIDKQQIQLMKEIDNYNALVNANEESDREIESLACSVDVSDASISQVSTITNESDETFNELEERVSKYLKQKDTIIEDIAVIKEELLSIIANAEENKAKELSMETEEIDYSTNKLPIITKEVENLNNKVKEEGEALCQEKVKQTNQTVAMEQLTNGVVPEKKQELESIQRNIILKKVQIAEIECNHKSSIYTKQEELSSKHIELKQIEEQYELLILDIHNNNLNISNELKIKMLELEPDLDTTTIVLDTEANPIPLPYPIIDHPYNTKLHQILDTSVNDNTLLINPLKYKIMQHTDSISTIMHDILECEGMKSDKKIAIDTTNQGIVI